MAFYQLIIAGIIKLDFILHKYITNNLIKCTQLSIKLNFLPTYFTETAQMRRQHDFRSRSQVITEAHLVTELKHTIQRKNASAQALSTIV